MRDGSILPRVLVLSAGGPAGQGVVRCLQKAGIDFIGADCDPYAAARVPYPVEVIPPATDAPWLDAVMELSKDCDLVHAQSDVEVQALSSERAQFPGKTFLPPEDHVDTCMNKLATYHRIKHKVEVPTSRAVFSTPGVALFIERHGDSWFRATTGAAGRLSLDRPTVDEAAAVMTKAPHEEFMMAEYLSEHTAVWQAIYQDGFLVAAQGRRRHGWAFSSRAPSGVTGLTGVGETVMDPALDRVGMETVIALRGTPHGIYGVDCCLNTKTGKWNPTEVNIGRFNTTIQFFAECGWNFPEMLVRLFAGEQMRHRQLNKCRSGMLWIRGIDIEPKLIHKDALIPA